MTVLSSRPDTAPVTAAGGRGPNRTKPASPPPGMARSNAVLAVATGSVGVLSYACTLAMVYLLPTGHYIDYSAAQSLLTSVGVAASALVPLPLSQVVRMHPPSSRARREAMAFAVWVSLLSGAAAAVVLTGLALFFTTPVTAAVVGVAALALFLIMPVWGWLQGDAQFGRYGAISIAEVALRLGFSVLAVLCGWAAAGALGGFVVGALVVALAGLVWARRDLGWHPRVVRERKRWAETGGIAAVQLVLSGLVGADVVLAALLGDPASPAVAGYQAVATVAKGPMYVATGTVLISFPLLRAAGAGRSQAILRQALRSYTTLAFPAAAVLATVPSALAMLVLPTRYAAALSALPWLALAGLGYGTITVLTVALLALRAYRRCLSALAASTVSLATGLLVGWFTAGPSGLAIGAALAACVAATNTVLLARPMLPAGVAGNVLRLSAASAGFAAVLVAARPLPLAWAAVALLGGLLVLRTAAERRNGRHARRRARARAADPVELERLQILHLGFEDPAAPGSGGGSLRTHEINRRLVAAGHRVTVLTTRFPGCRDQMVDGVHYVHIGPGQGRTRLSRFCGYVAGLALTVRRMPADLVVEDFFAPISSLAAPLWTGRPTVGVVQWLNARDKARQYKMPLQLIERFGVRHHRRLIAVSDGIAEQLRTVNPKAVIEVIGNGVDPAAFRTVPRVGTDVVFVGRLETAQKGLDLLLDAWAKAASHLDGQLVIAGSGPDEAQLRQQAAALGLSQRVQFVGWVAGHAKYELMAAARLVVLPSRFETFGIVAVEALATGTPVVTFDIPCLREVVPATCGRRVRAFDTTALARTLVELYNDPENLRAAATPARTFAASYDWDNLAHQQRQVYTDTLTMAHPPATGHDPVAQQLATVGRRRARSRRRRIVVLGNVGNGNIGDEALMAAVLPHLVDAEVTLLSRDPARATADHCVPAQPMTVRAAATPLRRADAVIVVGGGMFGPGLPPLVRLLPRLLTACRLLRRDIAYVGIGAYPGAPAGVLASLRNAARHGHVTVRDELSQRILASDPPPPCVGDLARRLHPTDPTHALTVLSAADVNTARPLLLLTPKAATTPAQTEQLLDWLTAAATHWHAHGGAVAALALSDRADHGVPKDRTDVALAEAVARRSRVPIPVLSPTAPELAIAITAWASAALGLRFHGAVFADMTGVPTMAPAWEPKTTALLTERGLPALTDTSTMTHWLDAQLSTPIGH